MPKYLVEMHDGRKFQVEADSQPSEADVLAHMGGGQPSTPYTPDSPLNHHLNEQEGAGDWGQNLATAGDALAHPKTASDIAGLLIPSGGAEVIGRTLKPAVDAAKRYGGAAVKLATTAGTALMPSAMVAPAKAAVQVLSELNPSEWNNPLTVAGREGRAHAAVSNAVETAQDVLARGRRAGPVPVPLPQNISSARISSTSIPPGQTDRIPYATPTPSSPVTGAASAPAASVGLSDADRALLAKNYPGLDPAKVEQQLTGRLQMAPTERPPITVAPESPMQPPAESPLQQPRVQVGAEVVGRQNGLTKQAVREQVGPLFNEAQGEASPVIPQTPFERLHDKLLGMGHGNPERDAYVQAARDPKTAGQLEVIRRTLERNGLSVAAATSAAEAIRRAVMQRLTGDQQQ